MYTQLINHIHFSWESTTSNTKSEMLLVANCRGSNPISLLLNILETLLRSLGDGKWQLR